MPEHSLCMGVLDAPYEQHQRIELCVKGRAGCGKSALVTALQGCASASLRPTLGLQVSRVWQLAGVSPQGSCNPELSSLIDFWEVGTTSSMGTAVLTEAAIPSSAATIHVLSMTDKVAFEQLPQLLAGTSSAPCIMVATKCDVVQSYAITVVQVQQLAAEHKVPLFLMANSACGHRSPACKDKRQQSAQAILTKLSDMVNARLW